MIYPTEEYYEDVVIKAGDSGQTLALEYGYNNSNWKDAWYSCKNNDRSTVKKLTTAPKPGDKVCIKIPWTIIDRKLKRLNDEKYPKFQFIMKRSGEPGKRLRWVQTVYQMNWLAPHSTRFSVDPVVPDDDKPFYRSDFDLAHSKIEAEQRVQIEDQPARVAQSNKTVGMRLLASLAIVTDKRVTLLYTTYYGFDLTPANKLIGYDPRHATTEEIIGHLHLLRHGKTATKRLGTFSKAGWTFRRAPR